MLQDHISSVNISMFNDMFGSCCQQLGLSVRFHRVILCSKISVGCLGFSTEPPLPTIQQVLYRLWKEIPGLQPNLKFLHIPVLSTRYAGANVAQNMWEWSTNALFNSRPISLESGHVLYYLNE